MHRCMLALGTVMVGLLASGATAQERPDFSGRWVTQPEAADAARGGRGEAGVGQRAGGAQRGAAPSGRRGRGPRSGDMGSGWGSEFTITQDATTLTVEYAFFARGDMQPPLEFVFALDGSETRDTVMMGRGRQELVSRASWDGGRLVLTTVHAYPDAEAGRPATSEVKRTLSLESPASLVVETTRSGVLGGPSSTTRTVYTRGL